MRLLWEVLRVLVLHQVMGRSCPEADCAVLCCAVLCCAVLCCAVHAHALAGTDRELCLACRGSLLRSHVRVAAAQPTLAPG